MINQKTYLNNTHSPWIKETIIFTFIFFINPLISILLLAAYILNSQKINNKILFFLYILLSLYLGLINSTKEIEGDIVGYIYNYSLVPTKSFLEFSFIANQEPVFYALTYIQYYLTFGSYKLYIIAITVTIYYPVFIAIERYWRNEGANIDIILFSIFLFAFLIDQFIWTTHLVRQMMGFSFVILFIINKSLGRKKYWIYAIIAVFIHSMTILFVLFAFIPMLNKKLNFKFLLIPILVLSLTIFYFQEILNFFLSVTENMPVIHYPLRRIAAEQIIDSTGIDARTTLLYRIVSYLFAGIIVLTYIRSLNAKSSYFILNICILFLLYLSYISTTENLLLVYRYKVVMFIFTPFVIPHLLYFFKNLFRKSQFIIIEVIVFMLILIRFYDTLQETKWHFASNIELIFYSPFIYFY